MGNGLGVAMDELKATIGDYLGWGRGLAYDDEEWIDAKQAAIDFHTDMCLRWVYFEATLDPRQPPHSWSWLDFRATIIVGEGQKYADVPDDFGGFTTNALTVTQDSAGGTFAKINILGSPYIDEKYANSTAPTGRPMFAAVRARRPGEAEAGKRELYVYPIPDAVYTIQGHYSVLPERLTAKAPYTYGGPEMSAVFISAARASAEILRDKIQPGAGSEWPLFQRSLASAIMGDTSRHAPKSHGRNLDRSDPSMRVLGGGWWGDGEIVSLDPPTYGGTLYD